MHIQELFGNLGSVSVLIPSCFSNFTWKAETGDLKTLHWRRPNIAWKIMTNMRISMMTNMVVWKDPEEDGDNEKDAEWNKVWSRLLSHLQPFFWLIARILTIVDKKYRILTRRDKRESYLIFCNKTMFRYAKNVRPASFFVSLCLSMALCDSHFGSHCHSLAYSGPLWLNIAL